MKKALFGTLLEFPPERNLFVFLIKKSEGTQSEKTTILILNIKFYSIGSEKGIGFKITSLIVIASGIGRAGVSCRKLDKAVARCLPVSH